MLIMSFQGLARLNHDQGSGPDRNVCQNQLRGLKVGTAMLSHRMSGPDQSGKFSEPEIIHNLQKRPSLLSAKTRDIGRTSSKRLAMLASSTCICEAKVAAQRDLLNCGTSFKVSTESRIRL